MSRYPDQTTRFWNKVDVRGEDECWLWTAALCGKGYGAMTFDGRQQTAHRISWQLAFGIILQGKFVLHSCDVMKCVNPKHLWLGNNRANVDDMVSKGRQTIGARNGMSKLTEGDVREIRELTRTTTDEEIGRRFGINRSAISRIRTGQRWALVK